MNRVIMMGRIVNDLELKTTPNGTTVCSFRIAVDRNYQKKGEERKSDFFNVVAWRATAEFINRFFGKGRMIMIEGEMQTRQYTDKNGNPATWYEIMVDNAYFTGEKANGGGNGGYGGGYAPPLPEEPAGYGGGYSAPQAPAARPDSSGSSGSSAPSDFSSADSDDYPF
ncbi:MAG: single-stranded DNA-binding protein [Lachnospiraceae bacterium]|nr:single-stranded DNA-binding protein [Ruminococcus sp.]MCM1275208.1 single-stranded DNA-binding protein [Lachnospiraceae bacterium]